MPELTKEAHEIPSACLRVLPHDNLEQSLRILNHLDHWAELHHTSPVRSDEGGDLIRGYN